MGNVPCTEFTTFHQFRDECSRLHDCPFDLDTAVFDPDVGIWRGVFLRPLYDSTRVVRKRKWLVFTRDYYPVLETVVTVRAVHKVTVHDRARIGTYTFNAIEPTASGCRLLFNENLEIDLDFKGEPRGYLRERELGDRRGYVPSLVLVDFGFRVEQPKKGVEPAADDSTQRNRDGGGSAPIR